MTTSESESTLTAEQYFLECSKEGALDEMKKALSEGMNVNVTDHEGNTALMNATWQGHNDIIKMLMDANADVHAVGGGKWTALMWASAMENADAVLLFLQAGANADAVNDTGDNALVMALMKGNDQIINLLSST